MMQSYTSGFETVLFLPPWRMLCRSRAVLLLLLLLLPFFPLLLNISTSGLWRKASRQICVAMQNLLSLCVLGVHFSNGTWMHHQSFLSLQVIFLFWFSTMVLKCEDLRKMSNWVWEGEALQDGLCNVCVCVCVCVCLCDSTESDEWGFPEWNLRAQCDVISI